jgi:RNA polymerase sigma factor (sigma-70 family)
MKDKKTHKTDSTSTDPPVLGDVRDPRSHAAWEKFIARYGPVIRGWCRQRFPHEADDRAHELICELVFRMMTFEYNPAEERFRGWLKRVTHHLMAKLKREKWAGVDEDGENPLDLLEAGEDLAARLAAEFDLEVLEIAKERVRPRVQPHTWAAYLATAEEHRKPAEVARELGMKVGAVFVAKHTVIKQLRQEIDILGGPAGHPEDVPAGGHTHESAAADSSTSGGGVPAGGHTHQSAAADSSTSGFVGLFSGLLERIRQLLQRPAVGAASPAKRMSDARVQNRADLPEVERVDSSIRKLARVWFPSRVPVGVPHTLSVQLLPEELASGKEWGRERFGPNLGGWTANFFVSFMSPFPQPVIRPPAIKVRLSVAAENFEIGGTGRAESHVPLDGIPPAVEFQLRGLKIGPGRIMIDFAQQGRPIGSIDLTPHIVSGIETNLTSVHAPAPLDTLFLNLATRPIPSAPDLVIKVFEHVFAGPPGRLQFVVSSALDELGDLPVMDGDFGMIDLKTDVAAWVEGRLGAIASLVHRDDATPDTVSRTLARVGYGLFEQLLPTELQDLYWKIRGRNVRTILVLSDEAHIPWELIKPFRDNPTTGAFEEGEFWGQAYALTRWLRKKPPAQRLSSNRIYAVAPGAEAAPGGAIKPVRDIVSLATPTASDATRPGESLPGDPLSFEEELEVLRSLAASGSFFKMVPARCYDILKAFEQGEFDLLHLAAHGDFAGSSAADASAVLMEDGALRAADLSPNMAGALRRSTPLIFFNSCHSGRLGFSLTRLGSWGAEFVHLGCGAFVGSLWPVTDRAASAFAQEFYRALFDGSPIGESMLKARRRVRERFPNDPTWLAYSCFASPLARLETLTKRKSGSSI